MDARGGKLATPASLRKVVRQPREKGFEIFHHLLVRSHLYNVGAIVFLPENNNHEHSTHCA